MPGRRTRRALAVCVLALLGPLSVRADAAESYVVKAGDSLWAIAGRFAVSASRLAEANRLSPASPIHPGQRLVIPAAAPLAASEHPASPAAHAGGIRPASREAAFAAAVLRTTLRYLGRPYQWAGIGNRGFDCSGLVYRVFALIGVAVPHSSFDQYRTGVAVPRAALSPGDLVFFRTYSAGPSHVGIYVGADRFVHASYSRGVIVSSLAEPYYSYRYLGARRL